MTSELIFAAIPENFTMTIRCPAVFGCQMSIHDANYRELCDPNFEHCADACRRTSTVTADVNNFCLKQERDGCEIEVTSNRYGDICLGRLKHLVVSYTCTCTETVFSGGGGFGGGPPVLLGAAASFAAGPSPFSLCTLKIFKRLCD